VEVLRKPRSLILACAVGIGPFALTALISTHMISYATAIGYHRTDVMTALIVTSCTGLVTIPLFSALSDLVGRRRVILIGALAIICYAWPFYALVDTRRGPARPDLRIAYRVRVPVHPQHRSSWNAGSGRHRCRAEDRCASAAPRASAATLTEGQLTNRRRP
jgi:hypothetical protein